MPARRPMPTEDERRRQALIDRELTLMISGMLVFQVVVLAALALF